MTTCPVVCVADVADCPTSCQDNSKRINVTLCVSGSCEEICAEYNYREDANPCTCESLPIACPKVVDYYDDCFAEFQSFYDDNSLCLEAMSESLQMVSFTGPYFVFCYVWICSATVLVVGWCYYNETVCPNRSKTMAKFRVPHSTASGGRKRKYDESATQTGYKSTLVGTGVHAVVVATSIGFQFLLLLTTLFYYMQQGVITRWPVVFEDEAQTLQAFIMTWMVGLPWTMAFLYVRAGSHTLFLRRCSLRDATQVAIFSRIREPDNTDCKFSEVLALRIWAPLGKALATLFSYPYAVDGQEVVFCEVLRDSRSRASPAIYHHMRRYVFDNSREAFEPVHVHVGTTMGDFVRNGAGLSSTEADQRRGTVGPNTLNVALPTVLSSLNKEFSKGFYVYQNYLLWAWMPLFYYRLGLIHTAIRLVSGCAAAYFQYKNDLALHSLSRISGEVR
jgi:hypothetical protein